MKFISHGKGGTASCMTVAEAEIPQPANGQVLIKVAYAGINRPDILQRSGLYPPPADASTVLGLEVAGVIADIGEGVSDWKIGDLVCALTPGGGYAEYCLAPTQTTLPIPCNLDLARAASLPEAWFTVWANLIGLAELQKGERLLVHGGSSGIGLAAIRLANFVGAESIVTVGSSEKADFCSAYGATHSIDYKKLNFAAEIKRITSGEGVDVVLDMVGATYFQRNLSALRKDGRLVQIAFLEGSKGEFDLMPIMLKRLRITGSTIRPRSLAEKRQIRDELLKNIWPQLSEGKLLPHVTATFPLNQVTLAHELMESSTHIGKILLKVQP